jgi:hypothetical protein
MPTLYSPTYPLRAPAAPVAKRVPGSPAEHEPSPSATLLRPGSAADDVADPSYWTAYDHYMFERDARAMRRVQAWTMLANAWSMLRPWLKT